MLLLNSENESMS